VTFRLHGSLPANRPFSREQILTSGKAFAAMDKLLDGAATGALHLKRPEIAEIIAQAIKEGDYRFRRYALHAWVIMANHVHLLVTPNVIATRWLGPLKGYTSHEANKRTGTEGQPLWQDESYDHCVRNTESFAKIRLCIEQNPVKAGLVEDPKDFLWSSGR